MNASRAKARSATPWISLVLMALAMLNPIGLDFIRLSFSGEALSRNIAGPILLTVLVGLCALALVEFVIRRTLNRKAERQAVAAEKK